MIPSEMSGGASSRSAFPTQSRKQVSTGSKEATPAGPASSREKASFAEFKVAGTVAGAPYWTSSQAGRSWLIVELCGFDSPVAITFAAGKVGSEAERLRAGDQVSVTGAVRNNGRGGRRAMWLHGFAIERNSEDGQ